MDSSVRRRGSEQERGAVLLISIAILVLLSLFATAFARLVNFERRAATNYTDSVRARLLAKAGIENALVQLRDVVDDHHYLGRTGRWAYGLRAPKNDLGQLKALGLTLDLTTTTRPSFALTYKDNIKDRFGDFKYLGDDLIVSGVIGRSYANGLDVFKLKVIDAASQLNLNHPDRAAAKRMLKYLLVEASVQDGDWGDLSLTQAKKIADHVIDSRPDVGFQSKAEIQQLIADSIGLDRWLYANDQRQAIRDMVTVYSWSDSQVIRPWNLERDARRVLETMPRAPVNINSAPLPLLVALFAELEADNDYGTFHIGYEEAKNLALALKTRRDNVPFKSWPELEAWIDSYTGWGSVDMVPFDGTPPTDPNKTWWDPRMIDEPGQAERALVPEEYFASVSPTWAAMKAPEYQPLRDTIKAMLNPNTMLNKFGLGANHGGTKLRASGIPFPRMVDKSDLVQITTEGCFDSGGVFEITSLGMIVQRSKDNALVAGEDEITIVAAHTLQVVTRVYDVLRLTTQADFEQHRALMTPGDFIKDQRAWKTLAGYNRAEFEDLPGWPGMVTHPVYSLARKGGEDHHAIQDKYAPALYDGHVTLSNLLGVAVEKHDFVAGFARGSVNAFKSRVWWDPKDQDPVTGLPINSAGPSHPKYATPRRANDSGVGAIVGLQGEPLGLSDEAWYSGQGASPGKTGWPYEPQFDAELNRLVGASYGISDDEDGGGEEGRDRRGPAPRVEGAKSELADPLDVLRGESPIDADGRPFWYDGTSLWNNGVALGPNRNLDESGNPAVLVFDSDNLNLNVGHSVRFWVQPLADPYLQQVEILYSFIGSQTGEKRETGFRLFKRHDGVSGVTIVLQAVPSPSLDFAIPDSNPSNVGLKFGDAAKYRWNTADGDGGIWFSEATVDVTPRIVVTDDADAQSPLAGAPVDPFNPEWLPHSWHWCVVNYGYTNYTKPGLPKVDVSLQVDMTPTQPPKGVPADAAEGSAGRIAFSGQALDGEQYPLSYGQIHGTDTTRNVNHGHPLQYLPLGWVNSIHYSWEPGAGKLKGKKTHGPFGDEYQDANNAGFDTGRKTEPGVITAGWEPPDPKSGPGKVTLVFPHYHWYALAWITPRLLGDFYHCDYNKEATIERVRHEEVVAGAIEHKGGGSYGIKGGVDLSFPDGVYGQQLFCIFIDESGQKITSFQRKEQDKNENEVTKTYYVGEYDGQVPFHFTKGSGWSLTLGQNGRVGEFGRDLAAGANGKNGHEWRMDVIKRWTTLERAMTCSCCTAVDPAEAEPKTRWPGVWDGAYMRRKVKDPSSVSNRFENGCLHDSQDMQMHESLRPNRSGDATVTLPDGREVPDVPCKMVFHTPLRGMWENIGTLPQLDKDASGNPNPIPAEAVCDDCSGCESCDVDGPLWFGGEPAGDRNFTDATLGELAPVDKTTVARAVFDNLVFLNSMRYRTDFPTGSPEWYQDRFFTGQMAEEYVQADPKRGGLGDKTNTKGYGAVFRRGLLELIGTRGRLGSMTWTVYPSTDRTLSLEPRLWHLRGEDTGESPVWRSDNATILQGPTASEPGKWRGMDCEQQGGLPVGLAFEEGVVYNGLDTPETGPELLVLGFQLKDLFNIENGEDTTLVGRKTVSKTKGKWALTGAGLPTPMYQSPVLEDVTINVIRESAQILYAEEGVQE